MKTNNKINLSVLSNSILFFYSLNFRIHSIPSVPIVDCFQKIRQQVKCYLQMSGVMGKQELQEVIVIIIKVVYSFE